MQKLKKELILASVIRKSSETLIKNKVKGFEEFGKDLMGMCAISSCALKRVLEENGIESTLIKGQYGLVSEHCWVDLPDHCIDLTLTQFGKKEKIHFIDKQSALFKNFICLKKEPKITDFKNWPFFQKPTKRLVESILSYAIESGNLDEKLKYKSETFTKNIAFVK